jgi:hypothetical protein
MIIHCYALFEGSAPLVSWIVVVLDHDVDICTRVTSYKKGYRSIASSITNSLVRSLLFALYLFFFAMDILCALLE